MKYPSGMLAPLRIADVFDILIVSVLVYTLVAFLRRTRASFVAVGLGIVAGLYVLARLVDMQLTAAILGGFFAIVVVMVVIIFQDELRQLFEQVALWGLRRRRAMAPVGDPTDVLVACLRDCARDRVGALVVVPGRQHLGRYLQGGIELEGKLSLPLLRSLFDPHSPGHDGAVVVEGDRVTRFATHLPLSRDFDQLGGLGTRHSAALGLAEATDALCLVVSEERGTVSAALHGRLERIDDPGRLAALIGAVVREQQPAERSLGRVVGPLRARWGEKLAIVALVTGLWFLFVPGGREATVTLKVPVEVANLPPEWELEKAEPRRVEVHLVGMRRAFYFLDRDRLVVMIDGAAASVGRRTFTLTDDNVRFRPPGVAVQALVPSRVKLSLRPVPPPS
jgi:uncharacterized protein (TIGR00159 family)